SYDFSPEFLTDAEPRVVHTRFGDETVYIGKLAGRPTACILRYGPKMKLPSHKHNVRARFLAFKMLGVERVISQNTHGSINRMMEPGDLAVPHDFTDGTKHRAQSMFLDEPDCWIRVDLTEPYCPEMRKALIAGAKKATGRVTERGVVVCFEGPRFETPAEIRMCERLGGGMVGTPTVPGIIFARGLELCYGSPPVILISGARMGGAVGGGGVRGGGEESGGGLVGGGGAPRRTDQSILAALDLFPEQRACPCSRALDQAVDGVTPEWLKEYWTPRT